MTDKPLEEPPGPEGDDSVNRPDDLPVVTVVDFLDADDQDDGDDA